MQPSRSEPRGTGNDSASSRLARRPKVSGNRHRPTESSTAARRLRGGRRTQGRRRLEAGPSARELLEGRGAGRPRGAGAQDRPGAGRKPQKLSARRGAPVGGPERGQEPALSSHFILMSALRGAAPQLPQSAGGARAQNRPRQQMESQDAEAGRPDSTLRACERELGGWSQRETHILPADWSDSICKRPDTGHGVCCCPAVTGPGLAARACPIHTRTPKWRASNNNIIIINVHVCQNTSTPERQAQNLRYYTSSPSRGMPGIQ